MYKIFLIPQNLINMHYLTVFEIQDTWCNLMHDINKEFVYIYLSDRETKFENRVRKRGGNGILKKDEIDKLRGLPT